MGSNIKLREKARLYRKKAIEYGVQKEEWAIKKNYLKKKNKQ